MPDEVPEAIGDGLLRFSVRVIASRMHPLRPGRLVHAEYVDIVDSGGNLLAGGLTREHLVRDPDDPWIDRRFYECRLSFMVPCVFNRFTDTVSLNPRSYYAASGPFPLTAVFHHGDMMSSQEFSVPFNEFRAEEIVGTTPAVAEKDMTLFIDGRILQAFRESEIRDGRRWRRNPNEYSPLAGSRPGGESPFLNLA